MRKVQLTGLLFVALIPVTLALDAARTPAAAQPASAARTDEWKSPGLRITPEEFKRLASRDVLVLDVRDPESYRQGHLPGALLMTPEELAKPEAATRLASEKRRIITYCS